MRFREHLRVLSTGANSSVLVHRKFRSRLQSKRKLQNTSSTTARVSLCCAVVARGLVIVVCLRRPLRTV